MLKSFVTRLNEGQELDSTDIAAASELLLDENASVADKSTFLRALSAKGETSAEIAGFVEAFLTHAVDPLIHPGDEKINAPMVDVCGTGGDKLDLFNVSTASIFVLAAGGACVVKHGNRGITSKSGSSDVLQALGVPIDLQPEAFADAIHSTGVAFLFAPHYHPAFKAVVPVRTELAKEGVRTVFNLIGPLLNPCRPDFQLVGVFDETLVPAFAEILKKLGRKRAWAVHGKTSDGRGMDEISTLAPSRICESSADKDGVSESTFDPAELGLQPARLEDLQGGDAKENAAILEGILSGKDTGPRRDIVALNAAATLVVTGLASDIPSGFEKATALLQNGAAFEKLEAARR